MYYIYVLYSVENDRTYIGQTDNLISRLERHNQAKVKSTKAFRPWELIYHEIFHSRGEAMWREKELKSHQGRDWIRRKLLNLKT